MITFSFRPAQFIAFARNGCFGQHASGLLERCRGDEGLGCQRRFGDTQQVAGVSRTHFAVPSSRFAILTREYSTCSPSRKSELPALKHGSFTQHLTNDNFDVFIVNLNALQTVYVLYFVNDVTSHSMNTTQTQNVVRRTVTSPRSTRSPSNTLS